MDIELTSIFIFLKIIDTQFPVAISQKQDLAVYANKLFNSATLCCEIIDGKIVSMVAGYTDNVIRNLGYISLVGTLADYRGQGLATKLVLRFLDKAKDKHLSGVHLYAVRDNIKAVQMYEKIGFVEYKCENESRPDDLHLIYYL